MKLIYHHRTMGRSSQGMHIYSLVNALEAAGHEVTIVSPPGVDPRRTAGELPLSKDHHASGIHRIWRRVSCQCPQILFELCELLYNLLIPFRLLPALRRYPDVALYERHAYSMFMGVLLGKWLNRPVILEINELAGFKRGRGLIMERLARWIDSRLFRGADHILVVSSVLGAEAQRRGAPAERVHVVPNAIDPARFARLLPKESLRDRFGIADSVVIGHVGLFFCWDRLEMLVEVVERIRKQHPEVKLLLVGDGPEMDNLKRRAQEVGLGNALLLPGSVPRDDVPGYIDAMDICVFPDSNIFGSPIALFESMAMGKACLVPDLGPMRDVIKGGREGLFFERGDYEGMEHQLVRLVEDSTLRNALGSHAREVVYARHTWDANAQLIAELIAGWHNPLPAVRKASAGE